MPVELTEEALLDALAMAGEWDPGGAQSAQAALEWMGWEGEGPLFLRRYDVQLFVWYTLPRKFLTSLERKRETADALARTLELFGGRAASYAAVCRAPETEELLRAWEDEDGSAWHQFHALLKRSGLEPPDTDLLGWGRVMGFAEACARNQVATALEQAIETRVLSPGARDFGRRQMEIANDALRRPLDGGDGISRIAAIQAERLEHYLTRGSTRGGDERRAILEPIAGMIAAEPPAVDPNAAREAAAPALWLLELGIEGIPLTQAGALSRALVREATERWPRWWNAEIHGPPHRETDVCLLHQLHGQLRHLRLLRRRGRRLMTTGRGRKLLADPAALLAAIASDLLTGEDFRFACTELAAALLLAGFPADWSEPLAERIQMAIAAEGWQSFGQPPGVRDISWEIGDFLRAGRAFGLLEREDDSVFSRDPLVPTGAGRAALITAFRARALGPRNGPY